VAELPSSLCAPLNKTFAAFVRYDPLNFDWVEITAQKTKSILTLEMEGRTPQEFTGVEALLWKDITEGAIPNETELPLRVDYGHAFKAMCARNKGTATIQAERTTTRIAQALEDREFGGGQEDFQRRLEQLNKFSKAAQEDYIGLSYDIPVAKNKECPNPSWLLWHYGFRLQESYWILPKKALEEGEVKSLFRVWDRNGISYDVLVQAKESNEAIRQIAARKLREELIRQHGSLVLRIHNADKSLQDLHNEAEKEERELSGKELDAATQSRHNKVRAAIRDGVRNLRSAIRCAEIYDVTECLEALTDGLRQAIQAQAQAFNAVAYQQGFRAAPSP
jgi:hypothetical protein